MSIQKLELFNKVIKLKYCTIPSKHGTGVQIGHHHTWDKGWLLHPSQSVCQLEQSQGITDCSNLCFDMHHPVAMIKKKDAFKKEIVYVNMASAGREVKY